MRIEAKVFTISYCGLKIKDWGYRINAILVNSVQCLKLVSRPPHTPKIEVFTFLDELEAFEHLLIYS